MKQKLFTLLTLLVLCVTGAWATDYVIDGSLTFTSNSCTVGGLTFTFDNTVSSSQTSDNIKINDKKVLKLGKKTWTITLPEKFQTTSLYIEGMSNNTGTAASVAVDGQLVALPVRPSSKTNQASGAGELGKLTQSYDIPASGSLSFTIDGYESLIRIVISGYVESKATTYVAKHTETSGNKAYLANEGSTISGTPTVLSFASYPMTVEGANIQAGNAQYQFTIGTVGDFTGVKYAGSTTYTIKPQTGVTITDVKAYGSSNDDDNTSSLTSGAGNSITLAKRGSKNTPVVMTPLTLQKDGEGYYFFTIGGKQSIIALEVTYSVAENIDMKISEAGYSTLFYDKNIIVPTGVKAYKAAVSGSNISLTDIGALIPANTGVILEASQGTYRFSTTNEDASAVDVSGNILTGTTTATTKTALGGTVYTLGQDGEGVVGLRSFTGSDIRAYSAYSTSISLARDFYAFDEDVTAINKVEAKKVETNVFYNLAGQQVAQPSKGLYIVNGKKVIIK